MLRSGICGNPAIGSIAGSGRMRISAFPPPPPIPVVLTKVRSQRRLLHITVIDQRDRRHRYRWEQRTSLGPRLRGDDGGGGDGAIAQGWPGVFQFSGGFPAQWSQVLDIASARMHGKCAKSHACERMASAQNRTRANDGRHPNACSGAPFSGSHSRRPDESQDPATFAAHHGYRPEGRTSPLSTGATNVTGSPPSRGRRRWEDGAIARGWPCIPPPIPVVLTKVRTQRRLLHITVIEQGDRRHRYRWNRQTSLGLRLRGDDGGGRMAPLHEAGLVQLAAMLGVPTPDTKQKRRMPSDMRRLRGLAW